MGAHHETNHLARNPDFPNRFPFPHQERYRFLHPCSPSQSHAVSHPRHSIQPLLGIRPPACCLPKGQSSPQCCRICCDTAHTARAHTCLQYFEEPAMPRRSMTYALTPPQVRASVATPTTQPTCPSITQVVADRTWSYKGRGCRKALLSARAATALRAACSEI